MVFESRVCLKNIPDDRAYQMVGLYGHYDKNMLPFSGGIMDQPNYYITAMAVIRGAING